MIACGQIKKQPLIEKKLLDIARVDKIEIMKCPMSIDTAGFTKKKLTDKQTKSFVDKWNHFGNPELRKYESSFKLTIFLKSGAKREFRIGGRFIKENNDYCINFEDEDYFSNLYSNASEILINQDSTLKTGWYYVSNDDTGYRRQLDKTLEIYSINPNVIVPVDQFKKLEITETKNDFCKYPVLVISFDSKGTDYWSIATEKSIDGKLALIVNDKLVIAPIVRWQVTSGVSTINRADYTQQDIDDIFISIKNEMKFK